MNTLTVRSSISILASLLFLTLTMSSHAESTTQACPDFLNHSYRKLHSTESINLCELYQGKPILIVNTASHCGFTRQFKPLEALYQKYKDNGFAIIGFSSDDFNQAAKDEATAAGVCYKNYGVTFTMLAPTNVKGKDANPTFQHLAAKSETPGWNFNKYLVLGNEVTHFGSRTSPLDSELERVILHAMQAAP